MIETFNTVTLYAYTAPFGAYCVQSTRFHFLNEVKEKGLQSINKNGMRYISKQVKDIVLN